MAKTTKTKKPTGKSATKPATKAKAAAAPKKTKAPKAKPAPSGPLARVKALHGSKDALVKKLADAIAVGDQDPDVLGERLRRVSNQALLRLERVVTTVKDKYGSRDKLIESLGKTLNKAKDKDYLAKLGTFPLPKLLDLARSAERRARA